MTTQPVDQAAGEAEIELDEEAKALKLEQAKAEARKAIAEAQKATVEAQLPTSEVTPPEGKVDVGENVGLVAEVLARSQLEVAARRIADEVAQEVNRGATLLIVEDRDLVRTDWPYEAIRRELEQHKTAIGRATDALRDGAEAEVSPESLALGAPLVAASGLLGAVASVAGMFRTDYSITSRKVEVGTTPLVSALAEVLRLVDDPPKVRIDRFTTLSESPIIDGFWGAYDARVELQRRALPLNHESILPTDRRLTSLRAERKEAETAYTKGLAEGKTPAQLPDLHERLRDLQRQIDESEKATASKRTLFAVAEAVGARFDAFATAVTTAPKEGGLPPLVAAAVRESLHQSGPRVVTHVLYAAVEGSGGETITKKGLFGRSGRVAFLGGCQVSYLLLDLEAGLTVRGGTWPLLARLEYDLGSGELAATQSVQFAG